MSARQNPFGHRSVRCKKHNVAFNPDVHDGCPLCRRDRKSVITARPKTSIGTPFLIAVSLVLMFVTVLIMVTGERAFQRQQAAAAAIEGEPQELDRLLDPTPHRVEIGAVEGMVYQVRPADAIDDDRLQAAMLALEVSLNEDVAGQRAASRLRSVFSRVLGSGYLLDLPSIRTEWESYREGTFATVGWFRKSTYELDHLQALVLHDTPEMVTDRLETILADLESMIQDGETEAIRMAAHVETPGPSLSNLGEATENPVKLWSRSWKDQLDDLLSDRPEAPDPEQLPALSEANNFLRAAVEQLRLVPLDAERGIRDSVEQRFTRARAAIFDARTQLAQEDSEEPVSDSLTA